MPYELRGKCVHKKSGEKVKCHPTVEAARKHLAALNINVEDAAVPNQSYAFDPFATVDLTKMVRILPQGRWVRGKRVLDITRDRLLEMAKNFTSGLPRFRVPVNLDHKDDRGKVGNVTEVQYQETGPDGPGLYGRLELSEKGAKAVEQDGYDAPSAEIVWSLNGAKYQDPETGAEHDNVLVGVALTPTPFFGHKHVALYSADAAEELDDHGMTMPYRPFSGAKSFGEYHEWDEEQHRAAELQEATVVFRSLVNNIFDDPETELADKVDELDNLVTELRTELMGIAGEDGGDDATG